MICERCLKEITLIEPQAENGWVEQIGSEWVAHYGDGTQSANVPTREFAEGLLRQEARLALDRREK